MLLMSDLVANFSITESSLEPSQVVELYTKKSSETSTITRQLDADHLLPDDGDSSVTPFHDSSSSNDYFLLSACLIAELYDV